MYRHVISDCHRSVSAWREPDDGEIPATEGTWKLTFEAAGAAAMINKPLTKEQLEEVLGALSLPTPP